MLAILFESSEIASDVILKCKDKGLILFWLLYESRAVRVTPPLTISEVEISDGCAILTDVLNEIEKENTNYRSDFQLLESKNPVNKGVNNNNGTTIELSLTLVSLI